MQPDFANEEHCKRDKSLEAMGMAELISWLGDTCELWLFEYSNISTGLGDIEQELMWVCKEVERALAGK